MSCPIDNLTLKDIDQIQIETNESKNSSTTLIENKKRM
jgi:hypothetical protein